MMERSPRKNHTRRFIGVVVCSLPMVLAVICTAWAGVVSRPRYLTGLTLVIAACLLGCLNIYFAFIRRWMYQRKYGSIKGYRFVSGLPVIGTLLQIAGCIIAFGSPVVGLSGLLAVLLDTGGLLWFPIVTWKDSSLWDA